MKLTEETIEQIRSIANSCIIPYESHVHIDMFLEEMKKLQLRIHPHDSSQSYLSINEKD